MKNNSLLKQALFTVVSLFCLSSCGSSGSSSSTEETAESYTFTLISSLANQCGIESPFTEVELLLQDEDWQVTERYDADENGSITFTSSNEFINYTLVAKTQTGESVEGLDIKSYYQAQTEATSTYSAVYDTQVDNESCECLSSDVVLTHRALTTRLEAYSSLPYDDVEAVDVNTTLFTDVEACREIDQDWPIASFMVTGKSTTQTLIGAANFLSTFEEADSWALSAIEIPEEITLSANEELAFTASQIFADDEHFLMNISESDESMLAFNTHTYTSESLYKFYLGQTLASSNTIFSQSVFSSHRQIISTSYDEAYNTTITTGDVDVDYTNFSELSADGTFDYSSVNNHPMSIITFTYNVLDDASSYYPVTWATYTEEEGLLASSVALTGYDDFVNQEATIIENTEVTLVRSFNTSSYQDYITYFQRNNSLINNEESDDDFNKNLHFYYISHQLN